MNRIVVIVESRAGRPRVVVAGAGRGFGIVVAARAGRPAIAANTATKMTRMARVARRVAIAWRMDAGCMANEETGKQTGEVGGPRPMCSVRGIALTRGHEHPIECPQFRHL